MQEGIDLPVYKIADVVFETNHIYSYTPVLCKKYVYSGTEKPAFIVNIKEEDILKYVND